MARSCARSCAARCCWYISDASDALDVLDPSEKSPGRSGTFLLVCSLLRTLLVGSRDARLPPGDAVLLAWLTPDETESIRRVDGRNESRILMRTLSVRSRYHEESTCQGIVVSTTNGGESDEQSTCATCGRAGRKEVPVPTVGRGWDQPLAQHTAPVGTQAKVPLGQDHRPKTSAGGR